MPEPDIDPRERRRPRRFPIWAAVITFLVVVAVPLLTVAIESTRLFLPAGPVLEVEVSAKGGSFAQIFWSADYAMSPDRSSLARLHQQPGDVETLRFRLPATPLEVLRFDPLESEGEVLVRRMRVLDDRGRTLRDIDPMVMTPLHQIASMRPGPDGVRIVTTPGANDPMLVMRGSWLTAAPRWWDLRFVTPFSLTWVVLAVVTLIGAGLVVIARDVRSGPVTARDVAFFGSLVLAVVGAKLALLEHYPVPVPFWDQWDGEGLTLYIPWADHGVTWRQMFTFHNEHRIFFSRLLSLTVLVLNGQWDPHLQIVINAALHATAALVFAAALWLAMGRQHLPGVVLAVALAFAPPFGIENTLSGFQSAFYFLVLFTGLTLALLARARPFGPAWFLGTAFALCSPFTVAGGILILPAIACLLAFRSIAEHWSWRLVAWSVATLVAIGVVAYGALPPPIAEHQALKAENFFYFRVALARSLAFPWINYPRATVLMWLPLAVLGGTILWRRLRTTEAERVIVAIGIWVVVQCLAMAYSRGASGGAPASRYLDVVALGCLANTAALLAWLRPRSGRSAAWPIAVCLLTWTAMTSVGLWRVSREEVAIHGPLRQRWSREYIRNVRTFVVRGDLDWFLTLKGPADIPYHSPALLASWLDHPYIRGILPTPVRAPLDLQSPSPDARRSADPTDAQPVFDSYSSGGSSGQATFESAPVRCAALGHLWFEIASSSTRDGVSLALRSLPSGDEKAFGPSWLSGGGWNGVAVRCPDGPFTVVARDTSHASWIAFRRPAEIALGSAAADRVIHSSRAIGIAAGLLFALALAGQLMRAPSL